MKCNKCGEEWIALSRNSMKFCPNCGMPLQTQTNNASSNNIIKAIIMQNALGDGLLLEPSILSSLAADTLKNTNPDALELIELAIYKKVPQELHALKFLDENKRMLGMNVILASLMKIYNEETSYEIVNLFAEALDFRALTPKINSIYHFAGRNWRILNIQNGKALIISDEVIEERAYHFSPVDITWEKCDIRSYLNGAFYDSLGQEKTRVVEEMIENKNNPWHGTSGGNITADKVFLLSLGEVTKYFGDSGDLKNREGWWIDDDDKVVLNHTDDKNNDWIISDSYNSSRIAKDANGKVCWWWLRSSGIDSDYAVLINYDGSVYVIGGSVDDGEGGVRPALWLNI